MVIQFTIYGHAQPQGSKSAFVVGKKTGNPRAIMREGASSAANDRFRDWRGAVAAGARAAAEVHGSGLIEGPLELTVCFYLPRPKTLPKKITRPMGTKFDCDKLARSVGDSLTNTLIVDDGHIVRLVVEKWYANETTGPCAVIKLEVGRLGAQPVLWPRMEAAS